MEDIKSNEEDRGFLEQLPAVPADHEPADTANKTARQDSEAGNDCETQNQADEVSGTCIAASAEQAQTATEPAASRNQQITDGGHEAQQGVTPDKYGRGRDPVDDLPPDTPQVKCRHLYPQAVNMLVESDKLPRAVSHSKPPGRPFKKGESGNPLGRPKGSRNQSTLAAEALIDGKADELVSKAVEEACKGNPILLRAFVSMIAPARRDRPVQFEMRRIDTIADAVDASADLIEAVSSGNLTPSEAEKIQGLIESHMRMIETEESEARIIELEQVINEQKRSPR